MNSELTKALAEKLLSLADNELILGHRNSEWTGHAPILEEDIAFANIALDEIGHAKIWYQLLSDLSGEDRDSYPDKLVFHRDAAGYRSTQLVELPIGDWAFTIVRQYLFDAAEIISLSELIHSQYQPLAEAAAKVRSEEIYHYRHSHAWLKRLGLGTKESNRRIQTALDQLWPYAAQLFEPLATEKLLVEAGFVPEPHQLYLAWEKLVLPNLQEAGLVILENRVPVTVERDHHTPYLQELLAELQEVARSDPQARW